MLRIAKIKKDAKVEFGELPAFTPVGGDWWRLEDAFTVWFTYGGKRYRLTIKRGFLTDFASIPRLVWSILAPWNYKYTPACLPHDEGYEKAGKLTLWTWDGVTWSPVRAELSRRAVDDLMYWGMVARKTPAWKVKAIYSAVRVGGWLAWRNSKKRIKAGGYRPDEATDARVRG